LFIFWITEIRIISLHKIITMESQQLLSIATQFGSPLYVYDAEKIQSQYNRLTNAFSKVDKLQINYAVKALSNISILKLLKQMGSGLDTVSIQEVQLGLHAGFSPDRIIYTPNGVSMDEIEEVAALGVQINIDNFSILEQFGAKTTKIPYIIFIKTNLKILIWVWGERLKFGKLELKIRENFFSIN